uniref:Serine/threonine-protein phosphatase n=1 Tax=Steinernema glaseri TaxID=37863 RepID=A0A1I7YDT6_9BILA
MPAPNATTGEKSETANAARRKAYEEKVKAQLEAFIKRLLTTPIKDHQVDTKLELKELREICLRAREQFMIEPALVRVKAPVVILGDLHGQFVDFIRILEKLGTPPRQKLLFLGDYVDRGNYSLETVTLLLAMKVRYPRAIWMLRGNHETRAVNKQYGFFEECQQRFPEGKELWTLYQHVFNCMPVAAIVGDRMFCVHGGISADLYSFKQFDRIMRPTDITDLGLLTDLIWADPSDSVTDEAKYCTSPRGVSQVRPP